MTKTGGGRFNPEESFVYFAAGERTMWSSYSYLELHPWLLISISEEDQPEFFAEYAEQGAQILLDSGIFTLTQNHMRGHPGMRMEDALTLHPEEIDGFDQLWHSYVRAVQGCEEHLWGYVELDQGGAERKRETRRKLEALGLTPIPVYHPMNDGFEYLDELCQEYDRVCVGNCAQARVDQRRRILATIWERRRQYPDVWIHILGLTPSDLTITYPINSCDSSSWNSPNFYGALTGGGTAMSESWGYFASELVYMPATEGSREHGVRFNAAEAAFRQQAIRAQRGDLEELFPGALVPPVDPREGVRL